MPRAATVLPLPAAARLRRPARRSTASAPSTSSSTPDGVPAEVHVVEPTGSETQVVAELGGLGAVRVPRARVGATRRDHPHHAGPVAGASVRCRPRPPPRCTEQPAEKVRGSKHRMQIINRRQRIDAWPVRRLAGGDAGPAQTPIAAAAAKPPNCRSRAAHLAHAAAGALRQPDEEVFRDNTDKFTKKTGVEVRVDFVGWEDIDRRSRSPRIPAPGRTCSSASATLRISTWTSWSS